ncbi:MAG: phytase, partial [Bacteroidales bacterium]|nr:phytase [Bacteroidales bacterium]
YKNGKWQYLFNSLNFIYLIDINGNNVGNYPIQLNAEASNGLVVLDYENNKNYRIIVAGKNGELYNYELKGRLLKDWKAENTRKEICKPLQFLITNNKEYLVFEANNGNIIMTDRRGRKRMEIRTSFVNALGSDIYVNQTNRNKGVLLTTDTEGNLTYIPETGSVNKTSFGKMSENHFFIYDDFNGNNEMDFIYLDGNKLRVFDKFKNTLLSYDFDNPISLKPQLFKANNKIIIGVVDQIEKRLYLLDKNGLIQDEKLQGNTPFIVEKLSKNAAPSLLIGLDNSIFNYPLD